MQRTTVYLTDTQPERIKAIATQDGITSAEVIRQAVELYLTLREGNYQEIYPSSDWLPDVIDTTPLKR